MKRMDQPRAACRRMSLSILLAAAVILATAGAREAVAQSDAGTVNASVTVESDAITVTGVQDLAFGTHFASEGVVQNEQPAVWQIDVSTDPTNVDLVLSILPAELAHETLPDGVFIYYDPDSFSAVCAGINTPGDPITGISGCDITPGIGIAELGGEFGMVNVDLSGAPPGTYTATVELTAIVN